MYGICVVTTRTKVVPLQLLLQIAVNNQELGKTISHS